MSGDAAAAADGGAEEYVLVDVVAPPWVRAQRNDVLRISSSGRSEGLTVEVPGADGVRMTSAGPITEPFGALLSFSLPALPQAVRAENGDGAQRKQKRARQAETVSFEGFVAYQATLHEVLDLKHIRKVDKATKGKRQKKRRSSSDDDEEEDDEDEDGTTDSGDDEEEEGRKSKKKKKKRRQKKHKKKKKRRKKRS